LNLSLKCHTGPCQTELQLFDVSEWLLGRDCAGRIESVDAQWIVVTWQGVVPDVIVKG
jgi:hypothetical protein